ncbi:unnamed protein product [Rotaria sp. Silwood1]|nr:unnamed protein product [Rotaria sp. Silwood1]CAF1684676.1 unnamed protein product [Rotaria sp. Silwood1]
MSNNNSNSLPEEEITHGDSLSWWSIFLDRLLYYLPYPKEECLRILTDVMINYYNGNPIEIGILEEFRDNYIAEHAIKWYTRESFVYRVLNKAFRQRNLSLLFLFGFLIKDLYEQLKVEYEKFRLIHLSSDVITVYRAQLMWNEEIQDIKNGYNKIVNWCLFSTTRNRDLTDIYLNQFVQLTDPIQNVLFEIKIDFRKTSYPYADISNLSYFPNESEVLFMIGTTFHLTDDIVYNEVEKRWLIKLELEEDRRKIIENNSLPNSNNNVSIRSCLKRVVRTLLQRIAVMSTDDIYIIFEKISELFPTETKWLFAIGSHCVANHIDHRYGNAYVQFSSRLAIYNNALVIWQQYIDDIELNCYLDMGDIHMEIGRCYTHFLFRDYKKAEIHFNLALENYELAQKSVFIGNNEKTDVYENVIDIYQIKTDHGDKSSKTLEMAIKNRQSYVEHLLKSRDSNDITLVEPFERLAELYKSVKKYDEALINYEKALEISKTQASLDYNGILRQAKEIVDIYTKYKNDPYSAMKYEDIIRDMESKEEVKFGRFMTALDLHKQRAVD